MKATIEGMMENMDTHLNRFILQDLVSGSTWMAPDTDDLKSIMLAKMDLGAEIEDFRLFRGKEVDLILMDDGDIVMGEYGINTSL